MPPAGKPKAPKAGDAVKVTVNDDYRAAFPILAERVESMTGEVIDDEEKGRNTVRFPEDFIETEHINLFYYYDGDGTEVEAAAGEDEGA